MDTNVAPRLSADEISDRLEVAARLAAGSRLGRLWHAPERFVRGQWFRRVGYRKQPEGLAVDADTIYGKPLRVLLPAGLEIYLLGAKGHPSELRLARLMLARLRPGDTFVDVGAHFGFFSGLAAELVGREGRVVACEAAPRTFGVLARNLANVPQAAAHHLAVAAEAGQLEFAEFPLAYSEYSTLHPEQFDRAGWRAEHAPETVSVRALPLDELVGADRAHFVKVDVEGAEDVVVDGASALLARPHPPLLCLEYLVESRGNQAHRRACAVLAEAGFGLHRINEDGTLRLSDLAGVEAELTGRGQESDNIVFVK